MRAITSNASTAASGFLVARAFAPSACTTITDNECATTSCSSRATSVRALPSASSVASWVLRSPARKRSSARASSSLVTWFWTATRLPSR